ncbi:peptidase M23 [Bradyrhizobium macuxiense]|uniref:Peptidase M23 n=1 Tax=Bradyrhizobium macuxiense TaxID=1755647 RepID=A0A125Q8H8_9BRAD|nr:peptidoglycan DD-metalloendopeptidase family protein [Bradyrhizobium macuxiense]KWV54275.1 peptidase M23 [Bradyrhizobium macuxiense]
MVSFVGCWLAALLLPLSGASADEFRTPSISAMRVEWRSALEQLRQEVNAHPAVVPNFSFASQRRVPAYDPRATPALVQLNAVTSPIFPGITRSPIPVLLPFDTASYLEARQGGAPDGAPVSRYQADFRAVDFFDAGASGYDAVFSLVSGAGDGMPQRTFVKPVEVQISGSLLVYDLADRLAGRGEPVKALAAQFPDMRRFIREGYVRYAFTRFGIPYVVSIQCIDTVARPKSLACREAYPVAERFLKALRVAGGLPSRPRSDIAADLAERPAELSPNFTYRPSGDIVANSGGRRQGGHPDFTVYSQIRFPLDKAPAFAHSQSYPKHGRVDEYPWQDNFCEARSFEVGQCASGFGHQGQDIRPGACPMGSADGCDPRRQAVVAVRDSIVIRSPQQQAATLQVNTRTEHIRFRYMHMNPSAMDADGLLNGRRVAEGETIGVVSNYLDHPNGTTRHLHFDVQVFTRDGWIWVNPYTTLVTAYERLIRGRGREIGPETAAVASVAHADPNDVAHHIDTQEGGGN